MDKLEWTSGMNAFDTTNALDLSWSDEDQKRTGYICCIYLIVYVGQSIIDKPKYVIIRDLYGLDQKEKRTDFIGTADSLKDGQNLAERLREIRYR
jgi:hypothetical protein